MMNRRGLFGGAAAALVLPAPLLTLAQEEAKRRRRAEFEAQIAYLKRRLLALQEDERKWKLLIAAMSEARAAFQPLRDAVDLISHVTSDYHQLCSCAALGIQPGELALWRRIAGEPI